MTGADVDDLLDFEPTPWVPMPDGFAGMRKGIGSLQASALVTFRHLIDPEDEPGYRMRLVTEPDPNWRSVSQLKSGDRRDSGVLVVHTTRPQSRARGMTMIKAAAEAFLQAVQAQTHERGPPPMVYRDPGNLCDVQFTGQVDVLAAMRAAVTAMRQSTEVMEEAGSTYVDGSQHIAVDGIWSTMIDAAVADGS